MPKIPDATQMGRRTPGAQRGIAKMDPSTVGVSIAEAGGVVKALGQQRLERTDRFEVAKAKTKWMAAKMEAEAATNGDKDYATMEERYRKGLGDQVDDIGGGIRNAVLRDQLRMQMDQDIELGAGRVNKVAWGAEVDHEKGDLVTDLSNLRQAALTMDASEGIALMQERIESTSESGFLSDAEAKTMMQKSAQDYAISKVKMAPAGQRKDLLQGPLGSYIPADIAQELLEKSSVDELEEQSQANADLWEDQGLDLKEAKKAARSIKDAELRRESEKRFDLLYKTNRRAEGDRVSDLYGELMLDTEEGRISYSDISEDDKEALSPVHRANLMAVSKEKLTGEKIKTSIKTYDAMQSLLAQKKYSEAREYFELNLGTLSHSDREMFSKLTTSGLADSLKIEPFIDDKEYLKGAAAKQGLGGKDAFELSKKYDSWYQNYQSEHEGSPPPPDESRQTIDDLLIERPGSGSMPFGWSDDYVFEGDTAADEAAVNTRNREAEKELATKPSENVIAVRAAFIKKYNREPGSAELYKLYMFNETEGAFSGN